jgi:hypothetical protein
MPFIKLYNFNKDSWTVTSYFINQTDKKKTTFICSVNYKNAVKRVVAHSCQGLVSATTEENGKLVREQVTTKAVS